MSAIQCKYLISRGLWLATLGGLLAAIALPAPADVSNATGLPVYPNLSSAHLEDRLRTDLLGHWCMHLSATTADSLEAVENWYRRAMRSASETDVRRDGTYGVSDTLDGIKLSLSLDSVAVYKSSHGSPTSIDLTRCGPSL